MRTLARAACLATMVLFALAGQAPAAEPRVSDLRGEADAELCGEAQSDAAAKAVTDAGDVNGDGIADLVVGAYQADHNGRRDSGSAYVVFGGSLPGQLDLAALGERGFRIDGATAGDQVGYSVAGAGDLNGDGLDDLLIGAPDAEPQGRGVEGAAYVVFGKPSTTPVDLAALGDRGFRVEGGYLGDMAGWSVSSMGDVNGDGLPALIVGAPIASPRGRTTAGSAYIVPGFQPPTSDAR